MTLTGHGGTAARRFLGYLSPCLCVSVACISSLPVAAYAQDTIAEIRVHGNHTTPEADILAIAGLAVGEDASEARLRGAEQALSASGRFDAVEVRRRYRTIADPSAILVIVVVNERPAVTDTDLIPGPLTRLRKAGMWLPILFARDGYGLTYGARGAVVDAVGDGSRLSVPLTWGGERRAAVELERTFARGPLSTARAGMSLTRRINPHFNVPDTRRDLSIHADRTITRWLRATAYGRLARVTFGAGEGRHAVAGADVTADTRLDPSFPRDAVHVNVGVERLGFQRPDGLRPPAERHTAHANRWTADVRSYVGIGGSAVLALRGQLARAGASLPPSEQSLLGGGDSLRGYRAGHRAGDGMVAVSAEARLPLTSPLSFGRFGVKAFADAGTTWLSGQRVVGRRFDRGMGGGVYFGATAVSGSIDVAWPRQGRPRVHAGFGVRF